jgi:hypothetical protein
MSTGIHQERNSPPWLGHTFFAEPLSRICGATA